LGELGTVAGVDSNVAECGGAVVLDIDIARGQQLDQDGDGAGADKLLAVVVCGG
jgi:hypothetical protein